MFAVALWAFLGAQTATPTSPVRSNVPVTAGVGLDRGLDPHDVVTEFHLPPALDAEGDQLHAEVKNLQVVARAKRMQLSRSSATEAWQQAEITWQAALRIVQAEPTGAAVIFQGTSATELNAVLSRAEVKVVKVTSPSLIIDTPLRINRTDLTLDLGSTILQPGVDMPYELRIQGSQRVTVHGGILKGGRTGVLVAGSQGILLRGMVFDGLTGGGIVLFSTQDTVLWENSLSHLHAAPIMLAGNTQRTTVAFNEITQNLGSSNWHAGVVLTDRNVDLAADAANLFSADGYFVEPQPMKKRLNIPQNDVVAYNRIGSNSSSGVYSDGSVRNVIVGNRIEGNSKEGLCLDDGSSADVVAWNTFRDNGQRWGKSDADLQRDYVLSSGRLPDGTAVAKLPAVSIDNAAYNQVVFNQFDGNFGGGVKMVRTGLYNIVGLNLLLNNNEGQSATYHFFGVELGAATADLPSPELDFIASRGNTIFGNTIRGTHFAGIFFAQGSDQNDVFDNTIFGATHWAIESIQPQRNMTLNNLTNLRSRNISAGLDPKLLDVDRSVYDTPLALPDRPQ